MLWFFPVVMYRCESCTIKKAGSWKIDIFKLWCWRRLLRVPWTARRSNQSILKEINPEYSLEGLMLKLKIKPVHPKGNQPWIFIGRTDAEAEAPILRPPGAKSQLVGKDPDVGKDWGQKEKRETEDEMVAQCHQLNGYEFKQNPGDSEGQGSLSCCTPLSRTESVATERQQAGWAENATVDSLQQV